MTEKRFIYQEHREMFFTEMKLISLKFAFVLFLLSSCPKVEGNCSVKHCTDPSRCTLSKDQTSCKCVLGFYSEKCDQSAGFKVMCSQDYMSVRGVENFFKYHRVPLESLHLPNKLCRAEKESIGNQTYYMFRVSKEKYLECGGTLPQKNSSHLFYTLSVQSEAQITGNIIRDPQLKMDFTCVYPYLRRVSLPFPITPISSELVLHVDEMNAEIQMTLFSDDTFSNPYTVVPTIELRDKVYVQLSVTVPQDYFHLRIKDCWATQFPEPNSTRGLVHTLINNGCPEDRTVSYLHRDGGQSRGDDLETSVRFSFEMFRFATEPHQVYLHCSVLLCELEDRQSCLTTCNSISKREAVRADPHQGLLSYGPIRIEMPDKPQSSLLTSVVLPVAGVWTLGFFLTVLVTVAKAGRRRIAKLEQH